MAEEERTALAPLVDFLAREGRSVPYLGSFPMSFTSINFVSMAHVLPILQSQQRKAIAEVERDLAKVHAAEAQSLIARLLDTLRSHVERLELLKSLFTSTAKAG